MKAQCGSRPRHERKSQGEAEGEHFAFYSPYLLYGRNRSLSKSFSRNSLALQQTRYVESPSSMLLLRFGLLYFHNSNSARQSWPKKENLNRIFFRNRSRN